MPVILLVSFGVEKETVEAPQLQFFDRGFCARAARWISGHYFLSPFLTVPNVEVTRQSWRLLDEFHSIFRPGHVAQHIVTVVTYSSSVLDGFGRIFDSATWLEDSVPEVGSFFLLWPRSSSISAVVCVFLVLLVLVHLALYSRRLPAGSGGARRQSM